MTTTPASRPMPRHPNRTHPVAAFTSLDRACRTAIELMRMGIDGGAVDIRVDGLQVVEPARRRPPTRALAEAAGPAAIVGAAAGGILAILAGGAILLWAAAAALLAAVAGAIAGAIRAAAVDRRAHVLSPRLGARRFIVQCDEEHIEAARRIIG